MWFCQIERESWDIHKIDNINHDKWFSLVDELWYHWKLVSYQICSDSMVFFFPFLRFSGLGSLKHVEKLPNKVWFEPLYSFWCYLSDVNFLSLNKKKQGRETRFGLTEKFLMKYIYFLMLWYVISLFWIQGQEWRVRISVVKFYIL